MLEKSYGSKHPNSSIDIDPISTEKQEKQKKGRSPTEILGDLRDYSGKRLSEKLEELLSLYPNLDRIVIMGLPATGKSTIAQAIRSILETQYPSRFPKINIWTFESLRKLFFQELHRRGRAIDNIAELTKEELNELDEFLTQAALLLALEEGFSIFEFPAVGEYPRGQGFLKRIGEATTQAVKGSKKRHRSLPSPNESISTLVIHAISTKSLKEFAKRVRTLATQCQNDYELKQSLLEIGINEGDPTVDDRDNTNLRDRYLLAANEAQIHTIEKEYSKLSRQAYQTMITQNGLAVVIQAQDSIMVAQSYSLNDKEEWHQITRNFLYAYFQYHREFGFPLEAESALIVTLNVYNEEGVDYTRA